MTIKFLDREGKPRLAYVYTPANKINKKYPLVMFCGGYRSDMAGTKATYLEEQCKARGQAYVRFDYAGHGESEGAFEDGTIGSWMNDAIDILDHVAEGPVIVVGSSMGGWMALLLAKHRAGKVQGVLGIAPAPDFTEDMYERMSDDQKAQFAKEHHAEIPNDYSDEPYYFTKAFYDESKTHYLLTKEQVIDFPIRLIHGMDDVDVPWELSAEIQKNYKGETVDITYIQDGDHRLSRPEDLEIIDRELRSLSGIL